MMSSEGNVCGTWNLDGVTLRGGFKDSSGGMEFYVTPGNVGRVESAVDMQQATKQYSLGVSGGGDLYLSAAAHRYFRLVVNGVTQLVCADSNALLAAYPVLFATSLAPAGVLNLNGKDQTAAFLSHLMRNDTSTVDYGVVTSGAAFGVVTSAVPATLTLTGALTSDQHDKSQRYYCLPSNAAVKFGGLAGLHFAGESSSATQVFSFVQSDSQGPLRVSSGTLLFDRGAGWSGAQDVVIDGTGVLAADAASAPVLFGKSAGRSRANLRIGGGGALNLPAGAQATVHTLRIGGTDAAHFLPAGVYGGAGAGLDAAHTLPCLTGGGTLFVRASGAGFIIMFR